MRLPCLKTLTKARIEQPAWASLRYRTIDVRSMDRRNLIRRCMTKTPFTRTSQIRLIYARCAACAVIWVQMIRIIAQRVAMVQQVTMSTISTQHVKAQASLSKTQPVAQKKRNNRFSPAQEIRKLKAFEVTLPKSPATMSKCCIWRRSRLTLSTPRQVM